MYNNPNIITSSDKGHIATEFYTLANLRTWLRGVIAICCMFMFNFGIVAKESNTYFEERVEVTESLNEMISKVGYAVNSDSWLEQDCRQLTFDFSRNYAGERIRYDYRTYGDTITERNNGKEVECFYNTPTQTRLKDISSRSYSINFANGLLYPTPHQPTFEKITYRDTISISQANEERQRHKIFASSIVKNGGDIILSEGDTIKNAEIYISYYEFFLPDKNGESTKATYTNTRWIVADMPSPIIEWIKYTGWNNNKEIATLSEGSTLQQKDNVPQNIHKIDSQEFQYITISDISGKVLRKFYSEEIADYRLPSGWYIITKQYSDKSISEKVYLE